MATARQSAVGLHARPLSHGERQALIQRPFASIQRIPGTTYGGVSKGECAEERILDGVDRRYLMVDEEDEEAACS